MHEKKIEASNEKAKEYIKQKDKKCRDSIKYR